MAVASAFHIITPVWGSKHVDLFLKLCVPSLLSNGNLNTFSRYSGDIYKIYTTSRDRLTIQNSSVYKKLSDIVNTAFFIIDDAVKLIEDKKITPYHAMTMCFVNGIGGAARDSAASILVNPDMVFSGFFLSRIRDLILNGKRLIMCTGAILTTVETLMPVLLEKFNSNGCISITQRELAELSFLHLHPLQRRVFWDAASFDNGWPFGLLWEVKGEGLIIHAFHLHPMAIYPSNEVSVDYTKGGIDATDYMEQAVPNYKDVYIITDSDEGVMISCDFKTRPMSPPSYMKADHLLIALWAKHWCQSYHLNFFKTKIQFHFKDISSKWKEIERDSIRIVNDILSYIDFMTKIPKMHEEIKRLKECEMDIYGATKDFARGFNRLGAAMYKIGEVKEAEGAFLKALEYFPHDAELQNNLAVLNLEKRNIKKALEYINKAIEVDPKNIQIVQNFAAIQELLGNTEDAIQTKEGHNFKQRSVDVISY